MLIHPVVFVKWDIHGKALFNAFLQTLNPYLYLKKKTIMTVAFLDKSLGYKIPAGILCSIFRTE